jgi:hypothetical protein
MKVPKAVLERFEKALNEDAAKGHVVPGFIAGEHALTAALEQLREELEGHATELELEPPEDLTAATVRAVKAQGIRDSLNHILGERE